MSVINGAALLIFGLLSLISVVQDFVSVRKSGVDGATEPLAVHGSRLWLRLGVGIVIVGGVLAIVCFGPLRPMHEWMR